MKLNILKSAAIVLVLLGFAKSQINDAINGFTIQFMGVTNNAAGESLNLALSPLTIWTLLAAISEGANGNTLRQLNNALGLRQDKNIIRNEYKNLTSLLLKKSLGVEFDIQNNIFVRREYPVIPEYQRVAKEYYDLQTTPVDFINPLVASQTINKYVSQATRNRIQNFVTPNDVLNSYIFMTSVLFFKGQWQLPFNRSATTKDSFNDEKGNKLGDVNMMYQKGVFPYARMEDIQSYACELPYGNGDMSMVLILPFKGQTVSNVLASLHRKKFSDILMTLDESNKLFGEEAIHVYLPKFRTVNDFNLNSVLLQMGVKDLFDEQKAELLGMVSHYLYVSRVIQRAEIDVNEEGTVATAASGVQAINKVLTPPTFKANHPFLYFIVDKTTNTIVFSGKISNPKDL